MRNFTSLLLLLSLSGCVTPIPTSYEAQCAQKGMVLVGVSGHNSSAFTQVSNGNYATTSGFTQSLSCRVPEPEEKCAVATSYKVNEPIYRYNSSVQSMKLWNVLGYLWIVPGLGVYAYGEGKKKNALTEHDRLQKELGESCSRSTASSR